MLTIFLSLQLDEFLSKMDDPNYWWVELCSVDFVTVLAASSVGVLDKSSRITANVWQFGPLQ